MVYRRRIPRRRRIVRRRRAAAKGRMGMRRYGKRSMNANKNDKATVVEVQELTATPEGGNFINHHLAQFPRALAVSQQYRFYRCKKVEVEFIPYANVFAPGTAFPELYFQTDRTQDVGGTGVPLPLPSKNIMMSRGVLPVRWTSVIKRSYTPSVLRNENFIQNVSGGVQSIAAVTSTPVMYKWYATQQYFANPVQNAATFVQPTWGPSGLRYFGAAYYIDQPLAAPEAILGTIKIKVSWEFKQPLVASEPPSPS